MNKELFDILPSPFHDGCVLDAKMDGDELYMELFRGAFADGKPEYFKLLFKGARDIEVYNYGKKIYVPATADNFVTEDGRDWMLYINHLDYDEGKVIFEECIRFACDDVEIVEASYEEF